MKQTYTKNHLLKYLYRETSLSETLAIEEALVEDRNLFEELQGLKEAYSQLPKVKFNPSSSTIDKILSYSKQTALEEQA